MKKRSVNSRLLLGGLVALVVLGPLALWLHSLQIRRTSDAYLERAVALKRNGEWRLAAEYIDRYRRLQGNAPGIQVDLAETYDRVPKADLSRKVQLYYLAVGAVSRDSADATRLKCRLAELLLKLGASDVTRLSEAEDAVSELLVSSLDEDLAARAWKTLALSRFMQVEQGSAPPVFDTGGLAEGTIGKAASGRSVVEVLKESFQKRPHDEALAVVLATKVYGDPEANKKLQSDSGEQLSDEKRLVLSKQVFDDLVSSRSERLLDCLEEIQGIQVESIPSVYHALLTMFDEESSDADDSNDRSISDAEEALVRRFRAGELPSVQALLASQGLVEVAPRTATALESGGLDPQVVSDEVVLQGAEERLRTLGEEYTVSRLMRAEYTRAQDLEGALEDVQKALRFSPKDPRVLLASGRLEMEASEKAREESDTDSQLKAGQAAQARFEQVIEASPRNALAYLALGELLLRNPDLAKNDGTGRIRETGAVGKVAPGDTIRCHFGGENNDLQVRYRGGASTLTIMLTNHKARGDQARVGYRPDQGELLIDLDPEQTTAGRVADELNSLPEFEVKLDDSIDHAVFVWQGGLRASKGKDLAISTRLSEVLLREGHEEKAELVLKSVDESMDHVALLIDESQRSRLVRRRDMLRAERLRIGGRVREAAKLAESVAAEATNESDEATLVDARKFLGVVYASQGRFESAARSLEDLASLQPEEPSHRADAARMWLKAEATDRAIRQFERALKAYEDFPTQQSLTLALMQQQRSLPSDERDWTRCDASLAKLRRHADSKAPSNEWALALVEWDVAHAKKVAGQEDAEPIRKELARLSKKAANSFDRLSTVVPRCEQAGAHELTDDLLSAMEQVANEDDELVARLVVLKSEVYRERGDNEAARSVIELGLNSLPPMYRVDLRKALLRLEFASGDMQQAEQRLLELYQKDPVNAEVVFSLASIDLVRKNAAGFNKWRDRLRKLEGDEGRGVCMLEARTLLTPPGDDLEPNVEAAQKILSSLTKEHPRWAAPHALLGSVAQQEGDFESAAKHFEVAMAASRPTLGLYQSLISCRCQLGQFAAAQQLLAEAEKNGFMSEHLSSMKMLAAAGTGDVDAAVQRATAILKADPTNHRMWLQVGVLLSASDEEHRLKQAEKAFLKAIKLDSTERNSYLSLAKLYSKLSREEQARNTLDAMADYAVCSPADLQSALAEAHEMLGDTDEASRCYQEALKHDPTQTALRLRHARMIAKEDPQQAEGILREALKLHPAHEPAQRMLAVLLARRKDPTSWSEAIGLLDAVEHSASEEGPKSIDNMRLQARLLVKRGGASGRTKAIALLQEVKTLEGDLPREDLSLLARLYELEGRSQEARREMLSIASRQHAEPKDIAAYVAFLLRQRSYREVEGWLDRLDNAAPASSNAVYLRASWLHAVERDADAIACVEDYAAKTSSAMKDQQGLSELYEWCGSLFNSLRMYGQAEKWRRKLYAIDETQYTSLALSLARQNRLEEATDICVAAYKKSKSAEAAVNLAMVLQSGKGTNDDYKAVDSYLNEACELHPENEQLILMVANMELVRQNKVRAIQLYRNVLEFSPENVLAMNNLAALLSEQRATLSESLKLISNAMAVAGQGEVPPATEALLADTKGTTLMLMGRTSDAIPLFERATRLATREAIYRLHLAAAYQQVGDLDDARELYAEADRLGLDRLVLGRPDRELMRNLKRLSQ